MRAGKKTCVHSLAAPRPSSQSECPSENMNMTSNVWYRHWGNRGSLSLRRARNTSACETPQILRSSNFLSSANAAWWRLPHLRKPQPEKLNEPDQPFCIENTFWGGDRVMLASCLTAMGPFIDLISKSYWLSSARCASMTSTFSSPLIGWLEQNWLTRKTRLESPDNQFHHQHVPWVWCSWLKVFFILFD